jgi:hypothetical protein
MAKLPPDALLAALRGSIGNLVVVHRKNTVFVRARPSVKPKKTAARKAQQNRFGAASNQARQMLKDAENKAYYEAAAKGTSRTAHNMATADILHPPTVEDIDLSEYTGKADEAIRIVAKDEVGVAEVKIVIRDSNRGILESGAAVRGEGRDNWVYTAHKDLATGQIITIEATAMDRPENRASKTAPHLTGQQS